METNKTDIYETPEVEIMELNVEGVLCTSMNPEPEDWN